MTANETFNIKNAIINHGRVNELLNEKKAPIRMKAGMLGKISVKVSEAFEYSFDSYRYL